MKVSFPLKSDGCNIEENWENIFNFFCQKKWRENASEKIILVVFFPCRKYVQDNSLSKVN